MQQDSGTRGVFKGGGSASHLLDQDIYVFRGIFEPLITPLIGTIQSCIKEESLDKLSADVGETLTVFLKAEFLTAWVHQYSEY